MSPNFNFSKSSWNPSFLGQGSQARQRSERKDERQRQEGAEHPLGGAWWLLKNRKKSDQTKGTYTVYPFQKEKRPQ